MQQKYSPLYFYKQVYIADTYLENVKQQQQQINNLICTPNS